MNFAKTVFSVCTGTRGFPALLEVSPVRAFFHLALLIMLSSIFIAGCRLIPIQKDSMRVCETLAENFGDVMLKPDGIFPSKAPASHLAVILSSQARLDYFPAAASISLSDMDSWKSLCGVIWTPELACFWLRASAKDNEGLYSIWSIVDSKQPSGFDSSSMGKAKLEALLKAAKWTGFKQPLRERFCLSRIWLWSLALSSR